MGLVLSGGGARAAYQAGVLAGINEALQGNDLPQPFPILTGVSAGAINASYLASAVGPFSHQVSQLVTLWSELLPEQVIRTDVRSLGRLGLGWIKDLSSGGSFGQSKSTYLIDSTPLRSLLTQRVSFKQIRSNLFDGTLQGVAVTATSYATGTSITFFDTPDTSNGGIRSNAPFSPAIHLGADRILAIGVRDLKTDSETLERSQTEKMKTITTADISGVILNSIFLDALEFDYERLQRINQTIQVLQEDNCVRHPSELRVIPTLLIRPSQDLGIMATEQFDRFPAMLKYLLRGLGASPEKGGDLLSYIAFDRNYTRRLVDLGLSDARNQRDEIIRFFFD